MYNSWKQSVLGEPLTTVDGVTNPNGIECVTVDWSWANYLFPNVSIQDTITTGNANTLFANASPQYFQKLPNTIIGGNSVTPQQGDIAVFGATPSAGVSNTYQNPYGHTGVVDSWDSGGVTLVEQDGSSQSLPTHIKYVAYSYDPLIGLLRPIGVNMTPTVNQGDINQLVPALLNRQPTDGDNGFIGDNFKDYMYKYVEGAEFVTQQKSYIQAVANAAELTQERDNTLYPFVNAVWAALGLEGSPDATKLVTVTNAITALKNASGGTVLAPGTYKVE